MELDVRQPLHLPAGGGEIIRDTPESRVEFLSDCDELHATWTRFAPHRNGAEPHVHREHSDLFYVLAGELMVLVGPEQAETPLQPGTLVHAPPLVVHGFRNAADTELRYLNFHAPGGGFAAYMRGERPGFDSYDPPADGGRPAEDASIGTGEVLVDGPELRVALLCDVEKIALVEVHATGGGSPPLHFHERHVESFYVLEGEVAFTTGDREFVAAAGSWVQLPAGVPHTFGPAGAGTTRFLNVHTPSCGFGDFVRALHAARSEDELAAARAAFDQRGA